MFHYMEPNIPSKAVWIAQRPSFRMTRKRRTSQTSIMTYRARRTRGKVTSYGKRITWGGTNPPLDIPRERPEQVMRRNKPLSMPTKSRQRRTTGITRTERMNNLSPKVHNAPTSDTNLQHRVIILRKANPIQKVLTLTKMVSPKQKTNGSTLLTTHFRQSRT
jgi:hypothetical protein